MAASKDTRATHEDKESFGLLANGSSGQWGVAIDEATSGADRWFAQIEGQSVYLYFEIPSIDIVGKILQFLELRPVLANHPSANSEDPNGSLVIGKDRRTPVTLIRDDEFADRFFLAVGPVDSPIVRFAIAGMDVLKIAEALRQVKEDLEDEE